MYARADARPGPYARIRRQAQREENPASNPSVCFVIWHVECACPAARPMAPDHQ